MSLQVGPIPKHYQLTEILRHRILSGDLRPGDRFPTEAELCRTFGVSRGTVRRALDVLAREGLVRREQGRGTFVRSSRPVSAFFTLTNFNEDMRRQHRQPGTRLLSLEVRPASPEIADRLALPPDEPVIRIVRLRLADGQPVVHETRHLAQSLCPGLLQEDLEKDSIHILLLRKYRLPLIRTTHTIEAHIFTPEEATLFGVPPGSPAFYVDRLTFTVDETGERPAVLYQALYRGDEYHFKAEFGVSL